jgi:hypothetical protein
MTNWFIRAEIARWADSDPQPGIVECRFDDANGRTWSFLGKYDKFTDKNLWSDSIYPQPGYLACEIVSRRTDEHGCQLAEVETSRIKLTLGHESMDGHSRFTILAEQLESR